MTQHLSAFESTKRIASGPSQQVAATVRAIYKSNPSANVLVFDDATGHQTDVDLRPTPQSPPEAPRPTATQGRGRPKLGVVGREVTLLPRHWEWLSTQPGGASNALRKLVEAASRANVGKDQLRQRQEAAYRFMSATCGDLPGYEEAIRALFADDMGGMQQHTQSWPEDLRAYAMNLGYPKG